jgi:tRNA (guanine-N7-)-methyltransferase
MAPDDEDTEHSEGAAHSTELRSFGRKRGRKMSPRQAHLFEHVLPTVTIDPAHHPLLPPASLGRPVWIEIGFGGGEHLLWQAENNPEVFYVGCEPFLDGVVKVLSGIEDHALKNIALHAEDARPVLRALPEASISRAFILFPDPWPKRKHVKRRLVSTATLDMMARVMQPGAELRIGTDIGDYARTILLAVMAHPQFRWPATGPQDWRERPADWPPTRYEEKAIREGRARYYFRFQRV